MVSSRGVGFLGERVRIITPQASQPGNVTYAIEGRIVLARCLGCWSGWGADGSNTIEARALVQPSHANLLFLDLVLLGTLKLHFELAWRTLARGAWVRETYDSADASKLLIGSNSYRLNEELIATSGLGGRIGFHCLQKDYDKSAQLL